MKLHLKLGRVFVDLTNSGRLPDRQTGNRKGSAPNLVSVSGTNGHKTTANIMHYQLNTFLHFSDKLDELLQ